MIRQSALAGVLEQVKSGDVESALLFNREGLLMGFTGKAEDKEPSNVTAALVSSIWGSFDKKINREELRDAIIVCEDGVVIVTKVANMLLGLKGKKDANLGMLRTKLRSLADYLQEPLNQVAKQM